MDTFARADHYISDFGFSPIHVAVLGLYDQEGLKHPSLEDLINFVDEVNNAPVGNDWSTWGSREAKLSPLYADIIQMFRSSASELAKTQKPILDIINQKDEKWDWPPFHWAAFTGRLEQLKILVNHDSVKADPFILSRTGRNMLHLAAESKKPEVLSHILDIWEHNKDRLDINLPDRWKETPLHVAASGSAACVKMLLDKGANPNARQENEQVPLHYSSICSKDHERLKIVSLLSSCPGILLDARDQDGRTPIFELLNWPACVKELAEQGADLSLSDNTRNTAVHYSCIDDEVETLEVLLQLSSDPGAATRLNGKGNTPLIEAFYHRSFRCVRFLLKRPDINSIASKDGWAPVHYAAQIGDLEILQVVLTHPSFKRGQKTKDGKSAEESCNGSL
jgi:ankyrin repeat protein